MVRAVIIVRFRFWWSLVKADVRFLEIERIKELKKAIRKNFGDILTGSVKG